MLRDVDSAERLTLWRAMLPTMGAGLLIGGAVGYFLHEAWHWSGWSVPGAAVAGLGVGAAAGFAAERTAGFAGRGLVRLLTAAGDLPPAPSFSLEEALVAQGRYEEAIGAFEAHLVLHPGDHEARFAMVPILAGRLGRPEAAAQVLLAIRRMTADPRWDYRVTQALIDLYAGSGDQRRHLAELARFADRFRATAAGRAAKQALAAIKAERGR